MALKDWNKVKTINPYITHSWTNLKKGLVLEIHYDIGFGKQRNVTIYNFKKRLLSGFKPLKTIYCRSPGEAKNKALAYMMNN